MYFTHNFLPNAKLVYLFVKESGKQMVHFINTAN